MGLCLIAVASGPSWLLVTVYSLMVLVGVNLIIIAHEWGHFVVARMCGVKCEKFYIWFDIFGWKLCKFRWGDTEYGLGVLPLGGYVKMLGQEDNPARLKEELERAKAAGGSSEIVGGDSSEGCPVDVDAAEEALYDPRSYLAQSVPKRMAIISAGVIMNVVFALVVAVIAYYPFGVTQIECAVGLVFPGEAAWRAGIRVGDPIVEVAGVRTMRFNDLLREIAVGNIENGVSLVVMRTREDGQPERMEIDLEPDRIRIAPTIGIGNGLTPTLRDGMPVFPGSPAALARPEFLPGDRVTSIQGRPVASYAEIHAELARHVEDPLSITVERAVDNGAGPVQSPETLTVEVAPAPMRTLGLVMEMGPITAIQDESPAAVAAEPAFRAGDRIVSVVDDQDFRWDENPMTLPDQLRRLAERSEGSNPITVTVSRTAEGSTEPVEVEIKTPLRRVEWYSTPIRMSSPMTIPSLGIAYHVSNRVRKIRQRSPAAEAGLKEGEAVVKAKLIPPDMETLSTEKLGTPLGKLKQPTLTLDFDDEAKWPALVYALQDRLPGTKVELTLEGDKKVTLTPAESTEWFYPDRGLGFETLAFTQTAGSLSEAVVLGTRETVDALTVIFRTLKSLGTGQVSPKGLYGPVGIVQMAYRSASSGMGGFLTFLCLISANLAVINFLPIPVLDGGHILFLAYEGVRGKPPSEGVFVALSYLGLAFILLLMVWVLGLDFGLIPR